MKLLLDNLVELFLLMGIISISIGFFIWSILLGFIVTGVLLIGMSYITLLYEGGE